MPKVLEKKSEKKSALVDNIDALNEMLERVKKAQVEYEQFTNALFFSDFFSNTFGIYYFSF